MPTGPRPHPPVGTARCTLGGTYQSHKWAIIHWLSLTAANPQQADLILLAGKISTAWHTNMSPLLTTTTIMNSVLLVWTPTEGTEIVASDTTARTGAVAGADLNNSSSSAVITHRTGAYYRGGHSRSYMPGLPAADVTNGSTITGARATAYASAWSSYTNAINTGPSGGITGAVAGTVRFVSKKEWLVPPTFNPWMSHSCRTTLGIQRGRLTE